MALTNEERQAAVTKFVHEMMGHDINVEVVIETGPNPDHPEGAMAHTGYSTDHFKVESITAIWTDTNQKTREMTLVALIQELIRITGGFMTSINPANLLSNMN
jgi:hypothetical protein